MMEEDNILERFERQIGTLLDGYKRLKKENATLREKQSVLVMERDTFEHKHETIIDQIEKIMGKLQEFEDHDDTT